MAKSLLPGQIEAITFNLSQFDSPDDLLSALHQVRDVGLSGKIPLVFWDEFDTSLAETPLGWLRYFLAPMQDGKFQEGQISHPIGRAIFVFAGGTSASMAEFDKGATSRTFESAKGPDFVSRLKGYINVLGPNPVRAAGGGSLLHHPPGDPAALHPEARHASIFRQARWPGDAEHRPGRAARPAEDRRVQAWRALDGIRSWP